MKAHDGTVRRLQFEKKSASGGLKSMFSENLNDNSDFFNAGEGKQREPRESREGTGRV